MSRVMRSGRQYDPGLAPAAPKRRAPKPKAPTVSYELGEVPKDDGESTSNTSAKLITFGSIPGVEAPEGTLVLRGTGKRKGVSWSETSGVKLSPAVYKALTNKAPPIRRKMLTTTYPTYTRERADACQETDASVDRDDATPVSTVEAANRALGAEAAPDAANRAPSTSEIPETPVRATSGLGLSIGKSGETVYVTARTSRVLDTDSEEERSVRGEPQYRVTNHSPTHDRVSIKTKENQSVKELPKTHSETQSMPGGMSWFDEMKKVDDAPEHAESLPELDTEWYRDRWSRSQYLSAPGTEGSNRNDNEGESVSVNALIYEVDENYVLSDTEYEELLRTHLEIERRKNARASKPSQTSGAGPSGNRRSSRVTIEEVEDEGERSHILVPSGDERSDSTVPAGKGKGVATDKKKKKKSKPKPRTSLGVVLDKVERAPDISYSDRQRTRSKSRPNEELPKGFRSGGYAQAMYGHVSPRGNRVTEKDRASVITGSRRSEQTRFNRSRSRSRHQQDEDCKSRRSQIFSKRSIRQPRRDPSPPNNPSDSEESESDESESDDGSDDIEVTDRSTNTQIMKMLRKLRKENKKLQKKVKNQARSGYKAQAPKTYKGDEPNIEVYEQFLFEYNGWIRETGLKRAEAVQNVC